MRLRALAILAILFAILPQSARAESGRLNLHLDLGAGLVIAGDLKPAGDQYTLGFAGWLGVDYQVYTPIAIELLVGGGFFNRQYIDTTGTTTQWFNAGLGVRARFLDNREGYLNEEGGDYLGNYWVSAHLGYMLFDGHQFGLDVGTGYEFSVVSPLQLGIFARASFMPGGDHEGWDGFVTVGINGSIELLGRTAALDTDGDGLSDERENQEHHTDPTNPDTDGDGLNDGLEVDGPTDPTDPDSDHDGLNDGQEDRNANGQRDGSETDAMLADSDGGGVPDGYEASHSTSPSDPADDDEDHDRVLNPADACPGTAEGTEVDERGCAILRARMVLPGIEFAFNSAEILPASERTLQIALQILRDNADARVEVGGHTDNVGTPAYNRRLSADRAEAVKAWLVAHGIAAGRLRSRGYGHTTPVADNETEEGRARNRRIEFSQME